MVRAFLHWFQVGPARLAERALGCCSPLLKGRGTGRAAQALLGAGDLAVVDFGTKGELEGNKLKAGAWSWSGGVWGMWEIVLDGAGNASLQSWVPLLPS